MTEALDQYGLVILFAIVALQTMGVGGLPGKTALVTASVLAADGHFELWHVVAVTTVGVSAGGYAGYALARGGGRRLLLGDHALARRLARPLALAERFFDSHGPKAVFLARFFPGVKVVAAPAAGLARMPWAAFALWHTLGAVAFALLFGLTGYYAGRGALALLEFLGLYALVPLALLLATGWLALRTLRRRRGGGWFENREIGEEPSMSLRDLLHRGQDDSDVGILGEDDSDALARARSDGDERRVVEHRVRVARPETAEALAAIVRNYGLQTAIEDPGPVAGDSTLAWQVVATGELALDEEHVAAARRFFEELAAEYGGSYEGWASTSA